jgi:hypothetical protein
MHPIEHLRYIARADGADPRVLVAETASALRSLRADSAGLVVACQRIVQRHPLCGPLWWLCSRVVTAGDSMDEARRAAAEIDADPTASHLAAALADESTVCVIGWPDVVGEAADRRGDVRVLAIDIDGAGGSFVRRLQHAGVDAELFEPSDLSLAVRSCDVVIVEARLAGGEVVVADRLSYAAAAAAYCAEVPVWGVIGEGRAVPDQVVDFVVEQCEGAEVVPLGVLTRLIGPAGVTEPPSTVPAACPFAPELMRVSPI